MGVHPEGDGQARERGDAVQNPVMQAVHHRNKTRQLGPKNLPLNRRE